MGKKLDLRGVRFGRLTVIEEAGRDSGRNVTWLCRCDCGNECVVSSNHLRTANTASCGCFKHERITKHGMSRSPLYRVWRDIMTRTGVYKGAANRMRRDYIERGIFVCDEWQKFENFSEWAVRHSYEKGLQIDRIDNDRGYCPDNCRFVTRKQNMNNRRCTRRLSDGTPLAEFVSSFGIVTSDMPRHATNEYNRVYKAFKKHGEQAATMLVFDIALENFAKNSGFTYVKSLQSISNQ